MRFSVAPAGRKLPRESLPDAKAEVCSRPATLSDVEFGNEGNTR